MSFKVFFDDERHTPDTEHMAIPIAHHKHVVLRWAKSDCSLIWKLILVPYGIEFIYIYTRSDTLDSYRNYFFAGTKGKILLIVFYSMKHVNDIIFWMIESVFKYIAGFFLVLTNFNTLNLFFSFDHYAAISFYGIFSFQKFISLISVRRYIFFIKITFQIEAWTSNLK